MCCLGLTDLQIAAVSQRLLELHELLGAGNDVDVIWMVIREPLLLTASRHQLMSRLMAMRVSQNWSLNQAHQGGVRCCACSLRGLGGRQEILRGCARVLVSPVAQPCFCQAVGQLPHGHTFGGVPVLMDAGRQLSRWRPLSSFGLLPAVALQVVGAAC